MKLSLIQMNSVADKAANIEAATALIERAVERDRPDWVALPECFDFLGGQRADKMAAAEVLGDGPAYGAMRALAAKHKIFIHAGSMLEKAEGEERIHNTTVVFDRDGGEIARYRKIHMFDIETPDGVSYRESASFKAGETVETYECDGVTVGCSICYDLRFPYLFQALVEKGAQLIALPAAFTMQTGRDHWEVLCRARAIETQTYCRRAGPDRLPQDRQRIAPDLRAFDGDRPLGSGHRPCLGRARRRLGRHRSRSRREGAPKHAGAKPSCGRAVRVEHPSPPCGRRWPFRQKGSDEGLGCRRNLPSSGLAFLAIALCLATLPAQAGGIWRRGETADPTSLDPHKTSTVIDSHILDELYEGLIVYDEHAELKPGVAASWDISPDALTYTFHLRPDARWSDGSSVTADDFVYSFRRLMDPKTGAQYANILYTLKNARSVNTGAMPLDALGARAVDPATLELTLEHPAAYLLAQLTHLTALPVHRAEVEKWGNGFAHAGRMVGNGPFVLKSYTPNDRLILAKNPYFHDAAHVSLDGQIILPLEDRSAALRRFMAGEIDSYDDVPADQIGFVRAHLAADFKVAPNLGSYFYAFDTRHKPFDDVRVRTALAMVIDRDFLATTIWGGTMLPSFTIIPPGIPGYDPRSEAPWRNESPFQREDEAKALMKAAGYGPDHPLHLTFRTNQSENNKATAVAIADMWRVLGVTTEFIVTDATSHFAFLASDQPFDVVRSGWFADYPDAQNYLFLAERDNKGLNYSHFTDPAYDALMRAAEIEPDPATRVAILHKAEAILSTQLPLLPLLSFQAPNLVSGRLHGWFTNFMDHHPGRYIVKDDAPG